MRPTTTNLAIFLVLGALWIQFFAALVPSWQDGTYYAYGWYVPPLAMWFFLRRWMDEKPAAGVGFGWLDLAGLGGFVILLLAVRVLGQVDPLWRLPMWVHAMLVAGTTLWWLRAAAGTRFAIGIWPVMLFALTAVPYPTAIELGLVHGLTNTVVGTTVELFNLAGKPVVAVGERLSLGGEVVEVTEGCSGIRSFQSFLMASIFFGELFRLKWPGRIALVGVGLVLAVAINAGRALTLSAKGFSDGVEAAAAIHDAVGLAAFALSAIMFFFVAIGLEKLEKTRKLVSRRMVKPGN